MAWAARPAVQRSWTPPPYHISPLGLSRDIMADAGNGWGRVIDWLYAVPGWNTQEGNGAVDSIARPYRMSDSMSRQFEGASDDDASDGMRD